mgnify:CR=1 FL=1
MISIMLQHNLQLKSPLNRSSERHFSELSLLTDFQQFYISGIISIASSVNRETQDLYILDIIASLNAADPTMNSHSQVVVMITDENDNTPSFDEEEFKVNDFSNVQ